MSTIIELLSNASPLSRFKWAQEDWNETLSVIQPRNSTIPLNNNYFLRVKSTQNTRFPIHQFIHIEQNDQVVLGTFNNTLLASKHTCIKTYRYGIYCCETIGDHNGMDIKSEDTLHIMWEYQTLANLSWGDKESIILKYIFKQFCLRKNFMKWLHDLNPNRMKNISTNQSNVIPKSMVVTPIPDGFLAIRFVLATKVNIQFRLYFTPEEIDVLSFKAWNPTPCIHKGSNTRTELNLNSNVLNSMSSTYSGDRIQHFESWHFETDSTPHVHIITWKDTNISAIHGESKIMVTRPNISTLFIILVDCGDNKNSLDCSKGWMCWNDIRKRIECIESKCNEWFGTDGIPNNGFHSCELNEETNFFLGKKPPRLVCIASSQVEINSTLSYNLAVPDFDHYSLYLKLGMYGTVNLIDQNEFITQINNVSLLKWTNAISPYVWPFVKDRRYILCNSVFVIELNLYIDAPCPSCYYFEQYHEKLHNKAERLPYFIIIWNKNNQQYNNPYERHDFILKSLQDIEKKRFRYYRTKWWDQAWLTLRHFDDKTKTLSPEKIKELKMKVIILLYYSNLFLFFPSAFPTKEIVEKYFPRVLRPIFLKMLILQSDEDIFNKLWKDIKNLSDNRKTLIDDFHLCIAELLGIIETSVNEELRNFTLMQENKGIHLRRSLSKRGLILSTRDFKDIQKIKHLQKAHIEIGNIIQVFHCGLVDDRTSVKILKRRNDPSSNTTDKTYLKYTKMPNSQLYVYTLWIIWNNNERPDYISSNKINDVLGDFNLLQMVDECNNSETFTSRFNTILPKKSSVDNDDNESEIQNFVLKSTQYDTESDQDQAFESYSRQPDSFYIDEKDVEKDDFNGSEDSYSHDGVHNINDNSDDEVEEREEVDEEMLNDEEEEEEENEENEENRFSEVL
jgi:hypothetical protein